MVSGTIFGYIQKQKTKAFAGKENLVSVRFNMLEQSLLCTGMICCLLVAFFLQTEGKVLASSTLPAKVTPRCVVDPSGKCYPPISYFGADISPNGLMQTATGINSATGATPNGPWPQNAENYCFLAVVQAIANYTTAADNASGSPIEPIPYPTRNSEGPASGNPNDETSGQILYDMDNNMRPTGTLNIHGSGTSRRPFTLANTSHDFGGDPRAQAVAAYTLTPANHYYHQYIYHTGNDAATMGVAIAAATYQEPVIAFVNHAEHVVLVSGVWSHGNPASYQYASIDSLSIYNPWLQQATASQPWGGAYLSGAYYTRVAYSDWVGGSAMPDPYGGSSYWWNYPYRENGNIDPDPYMGVYQAGVDPYLGPTKNSNMTHWINNFVTIQRDNDSTDSSDITLNENGQAMTGP